MTHLARAARSVIGRAAFRLEQKKAVSMTQSRIGEINGRWALLFKAVLVVVPCINCLFIPWAVWVTTHVWSAQIHISQEDRVIATIDKLCEQHEQDVADMRGELKVMDARLDDMPPEIWKQKILSLESDMKINVANQSNMMTSLELIKQKLGVLDRTATP